MSTAATSTSSAWAPEAADRLLALAGLGLSTVLGILKSHGGVLQVESQPGLGTVFRLYFPAVAAAEAGVPSAAAPAQPRGRGETVLVIEDEDGVRAVVRDLLTAFGYAVLVASDGPEGLAIYREEPGRIHAVVTDMMMPAMQGPEVIAQLRATNPDVRIVAMSGMLDDYDDAWAGPGGRLAFVQKPMTGRALVRALQQVLGAGTVAG